MFFMSVCQCRRQRVRLHAPKHTDVLENARNDARLGNGSNHLQLRWRRDPPQWGHLLKSMANTLFIRAIQRFGVVQPSGADSSASPALLAALGNATLSVRLRASWRK